MDKQAEQTLNLENAYYIAVNENMLAPAVSISIQLEIWTIEQIEKCKIAFDSTISTSTCYMHICFAKATVLEIVMLLMLK